MKKFSCFIAILILILSTHSFASQVEVTSYFPTPFNNAVTMKATNIETTNLETNQFKLNPLSYSNIVTNCLTNAGATYQDTTGKQYTCDSNGTPQIDSGSIWKLTGTVIYPQEAYESPAPDPMPVIKTPRMSVSDYVINDGTSEDSDTAMLQLYSSSVEPTSATIFAAGYTGYLNPSIPMISYEYLPWGDQALVPKYILDIVSSNTLFGLFYTETGGNPTEGFFNTAMGKDFSFSGDFNTIAGSASISAIGSSNTVTGSRNITISGNMNNIENTDAAGLLNISGDSNTIISSATSGATITGYRNFFIGANIFNFNGNNNGVIGSTATPQQFNGNDTLTIYKTKVGINGPPDTSDAATLQVNGSIKAAAFVKTNGLTAATSSFQISTSYLIVPALGGPTVSKSDPSVTLSKGGAGDYIINFTTEPIRSLFPDAYIANATITGPLPGFITITVMGHSIRVETFNQLGVKENRSFNITITYPN